MTYKNWLKRQLRKLDDLDDELDENQYDDLREVIYESARRAALEGNVKAIQACKIRQGGVAPEIVQEVLAECLSYCEADTLTVAEAAQRLNISTSQVYALCERDLIRHTKNPIRIRLTDLEAYQAKPHRSQPLRHLK